MAVIATGISWRPSKSCDGYRGRLRTSKLAVIAKAEDHQAGCERNSGRPRTISLAVISTGVGLRPTGWCDC